MAGVARLVNNISACARFVRMARAYGQAARQERRVGQTSRRRRRHRRIARLRGISGGVGISTSMALADGSRRQAYVMNV